VSFHHIKVFYESFHKTTLKGEDVLHFFAHYLLGRTPENYNRSVKRDLAVTRSIILDKLDLQQ